jgi:general secretion pathway protein G
MDWVIARREARRGRGVVNPPIDHPITRSPDRPIREAGFTIIELLVVVSIIIILATMGMTQYRQSVIYSRESVLKEDLFRLRDAIDQYYADKGQYPSTLDALVSDGYVRKIPDDPFTKSNSSWQTVPAEPDPNNPTAEAGVYDVKSGSDATALDGTKYAEWN